MRIDFDFYRGKRVLVTGHTGFKGTWLCRILVNAGAVVTGYALSAPTNPNLFALAGLEGKMTSVIGDIRDYEALKAAFNAAQPEIVLHLAAQAIVRDGYKAPRYTYETNVMGTVNLLECIRQSKCVRSVLNVTTDKVYHNNEWVWGYRENEPLDGFDSYSNSKSCSELVTHSYCSSFFTDGSVAISTARAGNVIGGGDFANDRIIPDCVRAIAAGKTIGVRNPYSTRPYQHVLEPLAAYLMIAQKQYEDIRYADYYNVGPDESDCVTTGRLVDLFCKKWGEGARWENQAETNAPYEANFLKLDCSKLKSVFGWTPRWHIEECLEMVCQFSKIWLKNGDIAAEMDAEINQFVEKNMIELTWKQKEAIRFLRDEKLNTNEGMPQELFLLLSGLVPLPNVDLLITNDQGQLLLTRRNDSWFQRSWHIPGGCMHYGEEFLHCVQETARRELNSVVITDSNPISVRNVIRGIDPTKEYPRERGHNVAILFNCRMPEGWRIDNGAKTEKDEGYIAWFDTLPKDFMGIQHIYDDVLKPWIK